MSKEPSLHPIYRRADRLIVGILWAMFALSLALADINNTYRWALTIGLGVALLASSVSYFNCGTVISRVVNTTAVVVMCALHIHQGMGREELHFGIFVSLAFLLCYRNWRVAPLRLR